MNKIAAVALVAGAGLMALPQGALAGIGDVVGGAVGAATTAGGIAGSIPGMDGLGNKDGGGRVNQEDQSEQNKALSEAFGAGFKLNPACGQTSNRNTFGKILDYINDTAPTEVKCTYIGPDGSEMDYNQMIGRLEEIKSGKASFQGAAAQKALLEKNAGDAKARAEAAKGKLGAKESQREGILSQIKVKADENKAGDAKGVKADEVLKKAKELEGQEAGKLEAGRCGEIVAKRGRGGCAGDKASSGSSSGSGGTGSSGGSGGVGHVGTSPADK